MENSVAMIVSTAGSFLLVPGIERIENRLMLKTEWFTFKLQLHSRGVGLLLLCLFVAVLVLPSASAQADFTLSLNPATLSPDAVAPGGQSSLTIQVVANSGFSGTITLGCTVTASISGTVSNPVCTVSPPTLNGSGGATATISTQTNTTAVSYGIAITAADATGTQTSPTLNLTVLAVVPQFTITILSPVAPSSVPAGSGAQGTISVNPLNGYSSPVDATDPNKQGVYLSCASISPLVTIAPVCSFDKPNPTVSSSGSVTSILTISTFGPVTTGFVARRRSFYALWFPLPLLVLAGFGAAAGGKRSRKAWGLLALFIMSGSMLLLPACGTNTSTSTSTPNGITPANTYTFTIIGVDTNGVASSNTGSTTSAGPTVTLSVTAPPK